MKLILTAFICLLLTYFLNGQTDSIKLEVVKVRTGIDKTYYWLKDGDKNKYYTVCSCEQRHKKGEYVMIAKKDIMLRSKQEFID